MIGSLILNRHTDLQLKKENGGLDIQFIGVLLFIFFLPIHQKISTILIVANVALSVFFIRNIDYKLLRKYAFIIFLYVLYILAYFRDDYSFGIRAFEQKASLIAFPLIFMNLKIKEIHLKAIFKIFVLGCIVSYIFLFTVALFKSISFNPFDFSPTLPKYKNMGTGFFGYEPLQTNYFLGRKFAFTMQSTVLSVFYSLSVFLTLRNKEFFGKISRYFIVFFLSLGVIQIFGITGLLVWSALVFVGANLFKKTIKFVIVFFIASIISIGFLQKSVEYNEYKNLDNRLSIWPAAIKTIKKNKIIGLGYITAQDTLEKNYPKEGDFGAASQLNKLDAHNIYLQIVLESGLIGLISLLLLILPYLGLTNLDDFVFAFFMAFILLSMTESVFNIYIGISSVSFFYCLFLNHNHNHNHNTKNEVI